MKFRILLLVLCTNILHASEASLSAAMPQSFDVINKIGHRPLIILFDPLKIDRDSSNKEPQISTITQSLLYALISESAPIIVSRWSWDFLRRNVQEKTKTNLTAMISHLEFSFDRAKWKVYSSNDDHMMVFVPNKAEFKSYLGNTNTSYSPTLTDGDLLLGLKVSKLKKHDSPWTLPISKSLTPTSDNLAAYLKEILVTRADLGAPNDMREYYLNYWDIFLEGHGRDPLLQNFASGSDAPTNDLIAGMSTKSFSAVLNFFNNNISTRTLLYDSCYAGAYLEKPYQFKLNTEVREKDFNFIIISTTTFNVQTVQVKERQSATDPLTIPDFKSYFRDLNIYFKDNDKKPAMSLATAIDHVSQWRYSFKQGYEEVMQLPTIRFPNTEWFNVADIDKKLFRLNNGAIMRAVNSGNNQIRIPATTEMVLLETPYIPIPVIIEGEGIPVLVPQDINRESYFFKEIRAPNAKLLRADGPLVLDVLNMLNFLRQKFPTVGIPRLYIASLTIKLDFRKVNMNNNILSLPWGKDTPTAPLTFTDVMLKGTEIYVKYVTSEGKTDKAVFSVSDATKQGFWYVGKIVNEDFKAINFGAIKNALRQESTLPESIKQDTPTATFTQPLFNEYLKRKGNPQALAAWEQTLSEKQMRTLEKLLENLAEDAQRKSSSAPWQKQAPGKWISE